MVSPEYKAIVE